MFDLVQLKLGAGSDLRALLMDPAAPRKLFYDVRADANAMYFKYGIQLPPELVEDLQVSVSLNPSCNNPES
jgi:hypothetical protein